MQILVNSLISGLTIALLAVSFTVVYLPTRVFHIALGGIYALVPYIVWASLQFEVSWLWIAGVIGALAAGVVLSLACEVIIHAPLERKGVSSMAHLVASLGTYIVLVGAVVLIWGPESKAIRTGIDVSFRIASVDITRAKLIAAAVSVLFLISFYAWLRCTGLGLQFRALADNPIELALRGYDVRFLRLLAFGISGLLCSVAALAVAYDLQFSPNGGFAAVLVAVVAVIIGGRRSFYGALLGGIILGVLRHGVVWVYGARWVDAFTFALLALFLIFLPNGIIMVKRFRVEAEV